MKSLASTTSRTVAWIINVQRGWFSRSPARSIGESVEGRIEPPPAYGQFAIRQPVQWIGHRHGAGRGAVDVQHPSRFTHVSGDVPGTDRPAAVLHPFAPLEVDGVEFGASSAPNRRGPAEEPKAAMFQRMIRLADNFASVEVGRRRLMIEPAAFEQDHAATPGKQAARGGLAGRARSDDCNVRGDRFRRFMGAIDPHLPPVFTPEYNGEPGLRFTRLQTGSVACDA